MCWFSTPTLVRCLITNNYGSQGGGINSSNGPSIRPVVLDCTIARNTSFYDGGGIEGPTIVRGCTIVENSAGYVGGGGISGYELASVYSSIVWGNTPDQLYGEVVAEYSDVQNGWPGNTNISLDPQFVNPGLGDYRLASTSPCIDAGNPTYEPLPGETDLDGRMRVWDGNGDGQAVVDMGAYEYGSFCYGDLNCDGAIDFDDIDPFVLALSDPAGYQALYPSCDAHLADCDADGDLDFDDIDPFVAILSGG